MNKPMLNGCSHTTAAVGKPSEIPKTANVSTA